MTAPLFRSIVALTCVIWFGAVVETAHARVTPHAVQAATPPQADTLPEGAGKEVVARICTMCHGTDYITDTQRTIPAWREIVELMKGYGAMATDDEWKTVTDYIVVTLAALNANKAPASDVAQFFAVDAKVAEGVVAYRDKQGGFKTIDDLKKAPGLEAGKIDALQARLIF
jgi:competence protein ComEA